MAERADARQSVMDEPKLLDRYVVYGPSAWTRWALVDGKEVIVGSGSYSSDGRAYVAPSGAPTAPLVRVRLPWSRLVSTTLAREHLQQALRPRRPPAPVFLPKLVLAATDDEFDELVDGLKRGSNVLREDPNQSGSHRYESAPTDGIDAARLEADVAGFYL